jgi:signal transduction histidine kinase
MSPIPRPARRTGPLPAIVAAIVALVALAAPEGMRLTAPRDAAGWDERETARLTKIGERIAHEMDATARALTDAASAAAAALGEDAPSDDVAARARAFATLDSVAGEHDRPPLRGREWGMLVESGGQADAWWGRPLEAVAPELRAGAFFDSGRLRSALGVVVDAAARRRVVASVSVESASARPGWGREAGAALGGRERASIRLLGAGETPPPGDAERPRVVMPLIVGGAPVASVLLDGETHAGGLAHRRAVGASIRFALLAPLVVLLAAHALRTRSPRAGSPGHALGLSLAIVWLARALLAVLRLPPGAPGASVFRPDGFAAPAPLGLLRSPADLFLTMVAIALTVRFLDHAVRARSDTRGNRLALAAAAAALPLLWAGSVWAAAAAVYASAPRLFDAPFPDLSAISLLLLASFILGGFAMFRLILALLRFAGITDRAGRISPARATILLALAIVALGAFASFAAPARIAGEPFTLLDTLPLFAGVLLAAGALMWVESRPGSTELGRGALFLLGACLVLVPGVARGLETRDRERVREIAARFSTPRDEWRRLVLEEALEFFANRPRLARVLESGATPADAANLAFAEWLESPLASLASECALEVLDASGAVVSRFAIGLPSDPGHEATFAFRDAREAKRPIVRPSERKIGRETIDAYLGAAPLLTEDGRVAGAVVVTIPYFFENLAFATRPASERPVLLGILPGGAESALDERLVVSRFEDGRLSGSSDPTIAPGLVLPDELARPPFDAFRASRLYGPREATLVVPLPRGGTLAFTLARGGLLDTIELVIHVAVVAALFVLLRAIARIIQRGARQQPYLVTFREKLLAAFLVMAVLPALLMGVLTHELTTRRMAEASQREAIEGLESARALLRERSLAEARRLSETTLIRRLALGLESLGSIDLETGLKKFAIYGPRGEMLLQNGVVPEVPASTVRGVAWRISPVTFFSEDDELSIVSLVPILFEGADEPGKGVLLLRTPVDDELITELGEEGSRDLLAYGRERIVATNRPELFQSEILPRRMPSGAYVESHLHRKESVFGSGDVAGQRYVVAYGTLAGLMGDPVGALAAPLLYGQREIDATIARALASILYVTAFVLVAVSFLATIVAERIAKPVAELSAGTKRVSRGELSFKLSRTAGGELGELVDSFNSMTGDLLRSRERLLERTRTIEAILGNITTGVLALDRDGRVSTLNRGGAQILGLQDGACVGRHVDSLRDGTRDGIADALEAIGSSPGGVLEREIALPRAGLAGGDAGAGSHSRGRGGAEPILAVRAVGTRLLNEAGDELGRVLVFEDLTELIRSKKLLAWSEMARQVAHEIKNPLTPMKLSAQHIREAYKDRAPEFGKILEEGTEAIISEIESLRRIATEFSSFARMPRRVVREEALNEIVAETVRLYRDTRDVVLDVDLDPSAPSTSVDRAEMKRVFVNLVENAVHASAPGGRIRVGTLSPAKTAALIKNSIDKSSSDAAAGPAAEPRFVRWSRRLPESGAYAAVSIEDAGAGIPAEYRDRIFEPYFSTKTDGTGLGLAICRAIIEEHGGAIRVASASGRGTSVVIVLPSARPAGDGAATGGDSQ